MSRTQTLFEYAVAGDPRSPDCISVAVTAELIEEAVEYHLDGMMAHELREMLSNYLYEESIDKTDKGGDLTYVIEMVDTYLKDTQ